MAEEIIDLRDRIEKMRIQIENEATQRILQEKPLEIHQKTSNSNISLSIQDKINETNYNENHHTDSLKHEKLQNQVPETYIQKESFPSVSLSVKNPISSKRNTNSLHQIFQWSFESYFLISYYLCYGLETYENCLKKRIGKKDFLCSGML